MNANFQTSEGRIFANTYDGGSLKEIADFARHTAYPRLKRWAEEADSEGRGIEAAAYRADAARFADLATALVAFVEA